MYSLDIETSPFPQPDKIPGAYALEPYRDEFFVNLVCVTGPDGYHKVLSVESDNFRNDLASEIEFLRGKEVACHNAIFDIAGMLSTFGIHDKSVADVRWRDTSLLAKWVNNSQVDEYFRYSLRNCVEKWLPDHPDTEEFLTVKDNLTTDRAYWLKRVVMDANLTRELHDRLMLELKAEQVQGYIVECKCLHALAKGWVHGILVDDDVVMEARVIYQAKSNALLRELGINEAIVRSPAKMGAYVFGKLGLEPLSYTPSGNPCTGADDLKMIALKSGDERVSKLIEAKQALTVISKYVNGFIKAKSYLDKSRLHPSPRLFNGYTGRMSYSSKLFKKHQIGIAMHQLPRHAKIIKKALIAPEGYVFLYMDFASQELRIMAQKSKDKAMLHSFKEGKDLHAVMTENIYGLSYETIVEGNTNGDEAIVDQRNCGKLTNLSSMYRIGAKSLQSKFFTGYDKIINLREATFFLHTYKTTFPGIPRYWDSAIRFANKHGYVDTLAGRRFKLRATDWKGESSAINFPIQGSGADLCELAIALISTEFPDLIFQVAVHDSLSWLVPDGQDPLAVKEFVDNIDWNTYFAEDIVVDFPLDFAYGPSLGDLTPL